jgi:uncharacterized tellurite resistance protein B-like protein
MIDLIKSFFTDHLDPQSQTSDEQKLKACELASAALMVELMETDHQLDEREHDEFIRVLEDTFSLDHEDLNEVIELAKEEADQATSLYEFTRLINDHYEYPDKVKLIENLWRIAFADEKLDKYEESLIRRVSDLIYVSHSDFIQSKLKVRKK